MKSRSLDAITLHARGLGLITATKAVVEPSDTDAKLVCNPLVAALVAFPQRLCALQKGFVLGLRAGLVAGLEGGHATRRGSYQADPLLDAVERGKLADFLNLAMGKIKQGCAFRGDARKQVMAVFTQHAKEGHDKHVIAGAECPHNVADFIPVKLPDMPFIDTRSQQRGGLIGNAGHPLNGPCDTHKVPACQQLKHSVSNTGSLNMCQFFNASERYAQ